MLAKVGKGRVHVCVGKVVCESRAEANNRVEGLTQIEVAHIRNVNFQIGIASHGKFPHAFRDIYPNPPMPFLDQRSKIPASAATYVEYIQTGRGEAEFAKNELAHLRSLRHPLWVYPLEEPRLAQEQVSRFDRHYSPPPCRGELPSIQGLTPRVFVRTRYKPVRAVM